MSYLDNKTLDIVLEENTDFGFRLTFHEATTECTEHPVTGEDTNCVEKRIPLPVTGLSFSGNIADSLEDDMTILASFSFSLLDAPSGIIEMTLSKDIVNTIAAVRDSSTKDRLRLVGYYDVVSLDSSADITTRIMQGKVFVSDGVTD